MRANHNPLLPPEFPMPDRPGTKVERSPEVHMPMVFERSAEEKVPLRVYAAIQLRVPESGLDWLDEMIEKSRELDRRSRPRAKKSRSKKR